MRRLSFGMRLLGTTLVVSSLCALAAANDLSVLHPWSRVTPPGVTIGVGYLEIVNSGAADRLLSVSSPRAERVEIHESRMEDGMQSMHMSATLPLAAHSRILFAPGALHLMLIGVKRPLVVGERVPLMLMFERGGHVMTALVVEAEPG